MSCHLQRLLNINLWRDILNIFAFFSDLLFVVTKCSAETNDKYKYYQVVQLVY